MESWLHLEHTGGTRVGNHWLWLRGPLFRTRHSAARMGVHCGRGVMTITLRLKDARHYDHRQYLTEALLIGRTGCPPLCRN